MTPLSHLGNPQEDASHGHSLPPRVGYRHLQVTCPVDELSSADRAHSVFSVEAKVSCQPPESENKELVSIETACGG